MKTDNGGASHLPRSSTPAYIVRGLDLLKLFGALLTRGCSLEKSVIIMKCEVES